jgi:hypothetical protein
MAKAKVKWAKERTRRNVAREASAATKSLPRKNAYNPLVGEALILKMMRGQW